MQLQLTFITNSAGKIPHGQSILRYHLLFNRIIKLLRNEVNFNNIRIFWK